MQKNHLIPAVVLPSFLKAGLSFARTEIDVSGRIPSSIETVICFSSLVFGSTNFTMKTKSKLVEKENQRKMPIHVKESIFNTAQL